MAKLSGYERLKRWREDPKNKKYSIDFMRGRRKYFRQQFRAGKIAKPDIPKAYRAFATFRPTH